MKINHLRSLQDTAMFNYTSLSIENINYNNLSRQNLIILNEVMCLPWFIKHIAILHK